MMHESKSRVARASLVALLVCVATFGSARSASASTKFPASMQKALTHLFPGTTFCVPLCTACHLTTEGGPGKLNVFGNNLFHQPMDPNLLPGASDANLEKALRVYFEAKPAAGNPSLPVASTDFEAPFAVETHLSYDADGDGTSDYDELKVLDSPSLPGDNGVGQFCPSDTAQYGCFARVAGAPPPVDRLGLFSAGLVVVGLAFARRLRRKRTA